MPGAPKGSWDGQGNGSSVIYRRLEHLWDGYRVKCKSSFNMNVVIVVIHLNWYWWSRDGQKNDETLAGKEQLRLLAGNGQSLECYDNSANMIAVATAKHHS